MGRKFLIVFLMSLLCVSQAHSHSSYKTISHIEEISQVVQQADKETLVMFDVDYVITAPTDLIGRQKASKIRSTIFKEYEAKNGKDHVKKIISQWVLKRTEDFVEPMIKDIITELQSRYIPTIALTAIGRAKYGLIEDPMSLRISRLDEKGVNFSFKNLKERVLWGEDSGYDLGIVFSGKQSKGEALEYFLNNLAHWKPKHIIFTDDMLRNIESVKDMCDRNGINFTGFHYQAAIFDQDPDLNPELARLQIKKLDEDGIWLSDTEAQELFAKD